MAQPIPTADARVSTLRGAAVAEIDRRLLTRIAVAVVLVTLVGLSVGFAVAGARKNAQIDALRTRGVPVTIAVLGCQGLLGGSGSNPAGYACRGAYALAGRRYVEAIPGNVARQPGSTVRGIATPSDPALVSTAADVATSHPSGRVYALPAALLAGALATGGAAVTVRRRRRRHGPGSSPQAVAPAT